MHSISQNASLPWPWWPLDQDVGTWHHPSLSIQGAGGLCSPTQAPGSKGANPTIGQSHVVFTSWGQGRLSVPGQELDWVEASIQEVRVKVV